MIDWQQLYEILIKTKNSTTGEKHHIVPRHDNGTDEQGIVI